MSDKLMSFRLNEFLHADFKLAAAYKRKTMAQILNDKIVEFVEKTLADMSEAQTKRQEKRKKMI